jgi:hypothetical protein
MMSGLNSATLMRAHLKLNLLIRIRIICNIRHFLRNLESSWMIALLDLSPLSATYILVVLLLILIMNMLNNLCSCGPLARFESIALMIMFGV